MSSVPPTSNSSSSGSSSPPSSGGLQSLTPSNFIQFLVTEMQNQDPLNPTSSDQLLGELSQIGQLESSDQLQTSLTGMVQQNQVSAASSMIGKSVQGTDSSNNPLSGVVTSVRVTSSAVSLGLDNGATLSMSSLTSITNPAAQSGQSSTTTGS